MKKINSIDYGHKILGAAAIFLLVIPIATLLFSTMTNQPTFLFLAKTSIALGSVILLFLLTLLIIELRQDKRINKYFEDNRNMKLTIKNGLYECQACGNRQVKHEHINCDACGTHFKIEGVAMMQTQIMNSNGILPVSETLFIPLAARAKETTRDNPIIFDEKAVEIIRRMDTSGKVIDGGEIATLGILARTKVIDDEVKKILAQNLNATIINLGAGLDTRICRLDNGIVKWYDLDLPEVISIRRRFFTENEHIRFISKSVLDATWVEEVNTVDHNTVIIIAEGLLMYFSEKEVTQILGILSSHFPVAHMFFDVVHSYFVNKKISSSFLWGIGHAKEIEKLKVNLKLVQAWSAGNLLKERQSRIFRILNFLPSTRNRSQILHIQFNPQDK